MMVSRKWTMMSGDGNLGRGRHGMDLSLAWALPSNRHRPLFAHD
jgi:hypothetical protein